MIKKTFPIFMAVCTLLLSLACRQAPALLITSNPSGLKILLPDNTEAVTPLTVAKYEEGTYRLQVVLDDELKMPLNFEVVKGKTVTVHAEFYNGDPAKDLLIAARAADKAKIDTLAKEIGASLPFRKTVYQAAKILIEKNQVAQAASLISATGPHQVDQEGYLQFFKYCVEENATELLGFLFPIYSGPDAIVGGGSTLLTSAAASNQKEIAQYLLANKANPDLKDNNGLTPMAAACRAGNRVIASLLIDYKAQTVLSPSEAGYGIYLCAVFDRQLDELLKNPLSADFVKIDALWNQVEAALGQSMYDRDIYRKYHFLKGEKYFALKDYANASQSYLKAARWVAGNKLNVDYAGYFINLDIITWPKPESDDTAPFPEIAYKAMVTHVKIGNIPWALLWVRVVLRLDPAAQLRIYSDPLISDFVAANDAKIKEIIEEEILPE